MTESNVLVKFEIKKKKLEITNLNGDGCLVHYKINEYNYIVKLFIS